MSFSTTSIKIEYRHCHLHASCLKMDGTYNESKITLDDYIGNDNGNLVWGGENFSDTCRKIILNYDKKELMCDAKRNNGTWNQNTSINLDNRIANNDGDLVYLD